MKNPFRNLFPHKIRARYDAAQTNSENAAHWSMATAFNADQEMTSAVRAKLRNRARYETMNNPWLQGMIQTQASDLIGTGPRLQIIGGDENRNTELERAFNSWCRQIQLADKLRVSRMTQSRDGESFILLVTNDNLPGKVKLDLMLIDPERVVAPWSQLDTDDDSQADGVFFDELGRPVKYNILRQHPAVGFDNGTPHYFPAGQVVHFFRQERPEQHRGVPEISAALPMIALLRRYTLAMVKKMESSANISGVLETTDVEQGEGDELTPWKEFPLPRDTFAAMPRGWKLNQYSLQNPTDTQLDFALQVKVESARCLSLPKNVALGDSSGYNYASGRLDFQSYDKFLKVERERLSILCLDRVFSEWMAEYAPYGEVPLHSWHWDGRAHVDPTREANAEQIRLANKTLTLAEACASEGRDWHVVLRQRILEEAAERDMRKELGLPPAVAQGHANNSNQDKDDDDE